MIKTIVGELGPWIWWVIGFVLLGLEIILPGIFLLWVGLAAMIVGGLSFLLWETSIWGWQVQILVFALLALASSYIGKRIASKHDGQSDEPLLNQRTQSLVGRHANLIEAIENGRGRVKLDDTIWVVEGPDMKVGEKVTITAASSNRLTVSQA